MSPWCCSNDFETGPRMAHRKQNRETSLTLLFTLVGGAAYLWVCVIVLWSSPNIILFWEALVTFLMMPVLTVLVYMADKGYFDMGSKVAPDGVGDNAAPSGESCVYTRRGAGEF